MIYCLKGPALIYNLKRIELMPIFMDRHYIEWAIRQALVDAHEKDLALQGDYQIEFLTYRFDEERHTAFCLVDAPNEEAITSAYNHAYGDIPHELLEVERAIVETFLGRVKNQ